MKYTYFGIGAVLVVVFFATFFIPRQTTVFHVTDSTASVAATVPDVKKSPDSKDSTDSVTPVGQGVSSGATDDIENQSKLVNPPAIVRALYVTGWVAGIPHRVDSLIALAKKTNINAFVVDIKDYSGYLSYCPSFADARSSGACDQLRIKNPNELIKKLHDNSIYVIGRVSVFQDPVQAKAHPNWAIRDSVTGGVWHDKKGLAWLEVAAPEVTSYVASIAKDADARGFDEVNFDYVRFPSDGNLTRAVYTQWDKKNPRHMVLKKFFKDIRAQTAGITISADLFGLVTVQKDDLGIGQIIEDAYPYFDFLYPMVYPSHYASGFLGYKNPALYPYEVIKYSMDQALTRKRVLALNSGTTAPVVGNTSKTVQQAAVDSVIRLDSDEETKPLAKLRPWLQVFDLGAEYTTKMVTEQMRATTDSLHGDEYAGWLLWDPKVTYVPLRAS